MSKEVENIVSKILNPVTGISLSEEDRIIKLECKENELHLSYNREGLSPQNKKDIESALLTMLKDHYEEDQVFVTTVSKDSSDVYQSKPNVESTKQPEPEEKKQAQSEQANLKVGHGPAGQNKKRVAGVKKVVAISSCKGGVGKSTFTVNLAYSLMNEGYKVGVIDADIYGPSLPMLLGKKDAKPAATEDKKITPIDSHGLKFMSFGLFIEKDDAVIWRGPMLGGVLNQFLFDVAWGDLDYLLIDLPPGTGDIQLSMVQATDVDSAIIVSTPQSVAIADTIKGLNMFKKLNVPTLGMVENMSYFTTEKDSEKYYIFGKDGVKTAAKELKENFLGDIPLNISLRESCDNGSPYMANTSHKDQDVYLSYTKIAKEVSSLLGLSKGEKKGFFNKLFK